MTTTHCFYHSLPPFLSKNKIFVNNKSLRKTDYNKRGKKQRENLERSERETNSHGKFLIRKPKKLEDSRKIFILRAEIKIYQTKISYPTKLYF